MVTKARTATEAEEAILRAARLAFAQTGFDGTPIQQIAKEADVSTGLIYHYFKDKETLWRAVGGHAVRCYLDAVFAHEQAERASDPWEQFESLIRFGMRFALENPENMRLRVWNILSPSPHFAAQAVEQFLAEKVGHLQKVGVVRTDISPFALANYVSMTMRGWAEGLVGRDSPSSAPVILCPKDELSLTLMLAPIRKV